jgi:hypothetical protein
MKTLPSEQIFVSAVTIGELNDPAKAQEIENWLNQVEASFAALAMDSSCFRESARLMAGKSGAYFEDAMIAATGRVHGPNRRDSKLTGLPAVSGCAVQSVSVRGVRSDGERPTDAGCP